MFKKKSLLLFTLGLTLITSCGENQISRDEFLQCIEKNFSNQVPAYTGYTVSVKVSDYKFACEDTTNSSIYESIYSQALRTLIKFNGIDVDDNYDFRKGYQNKSSFSKEYVDILIKERPNKYSYENFLPDETKFYKNGDNLTYIVLRSDDEGNFVTTNVLNRYNLLINKKSTVHYIEEQHGSNIECKYNVEFSYTYSR